jgi:hypothetical protein
MVRRQTDPNIVQNRHLAINATLLERSQDTKARGRLNRQTGDIALFVVNRAAVESMIADDGAEQRRLSGTVWADQTHNLAIVDVKRDPIVGQHATEPLGHVAEYELGQLSLDPMCFGTSSRLSALAGQRQEGGGTAGRESGVQVAMNRYRYRNQESANRHST